MELTKKEMCQITGGGISWGILAGISAAISFVIGLISGYTNPTRCSN